MMKGIQRKWFRPKVVCLLIQLIYLTQPHMYGTPSSDSKTNTHYARAKGNGCEPLAALIESFGGFSPELMGLLKRAAEQRMNRLTHYEYDQTTWAARSWSTFSAQKLSVAVHLAMATELAVALGLPVVGDPRAA